MRDYVHTVEDNGGVHINSGILNHAFYRAAIAIGGKTWHVLGKIWYVALTERLKPEADFDDFARATTDIAGELYGNGGEVSEAVSDRRGAPQDLREHRHRVERTLFAGSENAHEDGLSVRPAIGSVTA